MRALEFSSGDLHSEVRVILKVSEGLSWFETTFFNYVSSFLSGLFTNTWGYESREINCLYSHKPCFIWNVAWSFLSFLSKNFFVISFITCNKTVIIWGWSNAHFSSRNEKFPINSQIKHQSSNIKKKRKRKKVKDRKNLWKSLHTALKPQ